MAGEQVRKEQGAFHEPAWERGVYAASASPAEGKLKGRERRAPVHGPNGRPKLEVEAPHEPLPKPGRDELLLSLGPKAAQQRRLTGFMGARHVRSEKAAFHEPAWERGVYAASASPAEGKLKRRERRAPVHGRNVRLWDRWAFP